MQIRHLERDKFDAAARLFADAFLDDPGWVAVGPDRRGHRHGVLRRYHRTALGLIERYGGPIYGAFEDEAAAGGEAPGEGGRGALLGVAATFAAGLYPPPSWTIVTFVPGFLLAGPGPMVRGLRFSAVQEKGHPHDPHVYLWFLAVDPNHQRGGVGRALLARVYEDAQAQGSQDAQAQGSQDAQAQGSPAPVYLDTANPANVPYYAANGYEELGQADGPRGAPMWFMQRSK